MAKVNISTQDKKMTKKSFLQKVARLVNIVPHFIMESEILTFFCLQKNLNKLKEV